MKTFNRFLKITFLALGLATVSCGNLNQLTLKRVDSNHIEKASDVQKDVASSSSENKNPTMKDTLEFSDLKDVKLTDQSIRTKESIKAKIVNDYQVIQRPVRKIANRIPTAKSVAVIGFTAMRSQKATINKVNAPYFEMMADIIRSFFICLGILLLIAFVIYCFYEFGGPKLKIGIEVFLGILLIVLMFVEAIIWVVDLFKD